MQGKVRKDGQQKPQCLYLDYVDTSLLLFTGSQLFSMHICPHKVYKLDIVYSEGG